MASPLLLPPPLAADLGKHSRTQVGTGASDATVQRFERPSAPTLYLKSRAVAGAERSLFDEAERLGWMHAVGLPVPAVLQYHEWKGHEYLLLTTQPGIPASAERPAEKHGAIVAALAAGLRTLHATNVSACPFDQSRAMRVRAAEANVRAGRVDESDFDDSRKGRSTTDLLAELASSAPATEARAFTHGDYCLPNVLLIEDSAGGFRVSGFVDCGNAGIADPYQDLALCARSVAFNFGPELVPLLFAKYGLDAVDESKLAYYQLLDEFF
ncbi:MAG TPA: APH(3') family aminoglycoside O-phosphotransferase [Gemmatimonadaceae bacterium]|nr:APH(3') family aminoglycoside O-phosphotransferase [Gemmatimonadaceae bacterium]